MLDSYYKCQRLLKVFMVLGLALVAVLGCSVKPEMESGTARIVLNVENSNIDLEANLASVYDVTAGELHISIADQDNGFMTLPAGRYRLQVVCQVTKKGKIRDLPMVEQVHWLRSGYLFRMRLNSKKWRDNDQVCPLEFFLAER